MKTLLMFPGQGSQYIGMCKDIFDRFSYSKKAFQIVDKVLNENLTDLILNGDENELTKSYNSQPAIMLVSVAIYLALKEKYGSKLDNLNIKGTIGHSLGEYSALCVSGVLSIEDTAKILKQRGFAMYNCVKSDTGMCAIIGTNVEDIQSAIDNIKSKCLVIANYNSFGQIVVSGYLEDIEKLKIELKDKAKKMIDLKVSGAFHSPLMKQAEDNMKQYIEKLDLHTPKIDILQNYSCKFENDIEKIRFNLLHQITAPIFWYKNIQTAIQNGFDTFIEIGPKNVLSGLVKRSLLENQVEKIKIINIENCNDIDEIEKIL